MKTRHIKAKVRVTMIEEVEITIDVMNQWSTIEAGIIDNAKCQLHIKNCEAIEVTEIRILE